MKSLHAGVALLGIVLAGLALRLAGSDYLLPHRGEPDAQLVHQAHYNSDAPERGKYPFLLVKLLDVIPGGEWGEMSEGASLEEHRTNATLPFVHARTTFAFLSMAVVPLVYVLARGYLSVGWALFAAALTAFCPILIGYSTQARPHSPTAIFALASVVASTRAIRTGRGAWCLSAGLLAGVAIASFQIGLFLFGSWLATLLLAWRSHGTRTLVWSGLAIVPSTLLVIWSYAHPPQQDSGHRETARDHSTPGQRGPSKSEGETVSVEGLALEGPSIPVLPKTEGASGSGAGIGNARLLIGATRGEGGDVAGVRKALREGKSPAKGESRGAKNSSRSIKPGSRAGTGGGDNSKAGVARKNRLNGAEETTRPTADEGEGRANQQRGDAELEKPWRSAELHIAGHTIYLSLFNLAGFQVLFESLGNRNPALLILGSLGLLVVVVPRIRRRFLACQGAAAASRSEWVAPTVHALGILLVFGVYGGTRERFFLGLMPYFAILAAVGGAAIVNGVSGRSQRHLVAVAVVVAGLLIPVQRSLAHARLRSSVDTYEAFAEWIQQSATDDQRVFMGNLAGVPGKVRGFQEGAGIFWSEYLRRNWSQMQGLPTSTLQFPRLSEIEYTLAGYSPRKRAGELLDRYRPAYVAISVHGYEVEDIRDRRFPKALRNALMELKHELLVTFSPWKDESFEGRGLEYWYGATSTRDLMRLQALGPVIEVYSIDWRGSMRR